MQTYYSCTLFRWAKLLRLVAWPTRLVFRFVYLFTYFQFRLYWRFGGVWIDILNMWNFHTTFLQSRCCLSSFHGVFTLAGIHFPSMARILKTGQSWWQFLLLPFRFFSKRVWKVCTFNMKFLYHIFSSYSFACVTTSASIRRLCGRILWTRVFWVCESCYILLEAVYSFWLGYFITPSFPFFFLIFSSIFCDDQTLRSYV